MHNIKFQTVPFTQKITRGTLKKVHPKIVLTSFIYMDVGSEGQGGGSPWIFIHGSDGTDTVDRG